MEQAGKTSGDDGFPASAGKCGRLCENYLYTPVWSEKEPEISGGAGRDNGSKRVPLPGF